MATFDQSLPMILYRTLEAVLPRYRAIFTRFDLTEQQWRVLRALWAEKPLSVAELANRALLPSPSLVGIVDRLERRGLVQRERSMDDRRVVFVSLTEKGNELAKMLGPLAEEVHQQVRACIGPREWAVMEEALAGIALSMKPPKSITAERGKTENIKLTEPNEA